MYVLAEGGGGWDFIEEWGDPRPERFSENRSSGERGSETESDFSGDTETERAERQGEGAQQEGEELKNTHIFSEIIPRVTQ